ncbi:glycosyltransferase [Vibrio sp. VGrn 2]|uniref:glycosyltransferase n=1 Tax=Vibrio sp. VGrn 2 TaxID=2419839 RepID=UPI00128C537E|nr:glycosyltransferase [Vibrio sp. VGrn 2]MPS38831.1 glycosyltransferase [Vibrio sp. VGrn 2]
MKNSKLVSVYIPTYNRPKLLKRAVLSVLEQSYNYIEVIICSDGEDKEVEELVESLRGEHKERNIIYVANEPKSGACDSRNLAISVARGHYIMGLDDDDYLHKEAIETLVSHWNDDYLFLSISSYFLSEKYKLCTKLFYLLGDTFSKKKKTITYLDMYKKNVVGNQIFVKSSLLKSNVFDNRMPALQDFELWFRLLKNHKNLQAVKLKFRLQYVDVHHGEERISKYKNRLNALAIIKKKHFEENEDAFKILRLSWKLEYSKQLSVKDIMVLVTNGHAINVVKFVIRKLAR